MTSLLTAIAILFGVSFLCFWAWASAADRDEANFQEYLNSIDPRRAVLAQKEGK